MRSLIVISLMLALFASCKKTETPLQGTDSPDFYIETVMNGQKVRINAGDLGYYMFTETGDNDGIITYTGDLRKESCTSGCASSFRLTFIDEEKQTDEVNLRSGLVDYAVKDPEVVYEVRFNTEETYTSRATSVDYTWDFGDGNISDAKDPIHRFKKEGGQVEICLNVKTSKGGESQVCQLVDPSAEDATVDFQLVENGNSMSFESELEGVDAKSYLWEFADGATAFTSSVDYDPKSADESGGVEYVKLTVTDKDGRVFQRTRNVIVNSTYAFCAANFVHSTRTIFPDNGLEQLGTVLLTYFDESGVEYTAETTSADEYFEILDISEYDTNENGQPTKRVMFAANGRFVSEAGDVIVFSNMVGAVAVAY